MRELADFVERRLFVQIDAVSAAERLALVEFGSDGVQGGLRGHVRPRFVAASDESRGTRSQALALRRS
jgi:hypothetical protein